MIKRARPDDMVRQISFRCATMIRLMSFETKALLKSVYSIVKVRIWRKKIFGARVEIGSAQPRSGFYTLDLNGKADFPFDLRNGLPFPDHSISMIYAEHVLEHFEYAEFTFLLGEVRRVLTTGGIFSIVVPDIRPLLMAYSAPHDEFVRHVTYEYPGYRTTKLDIINFLFYMDGGHKNAFDVENMTRALSDAGFADIRTRDFDPKLDREERRVNSLYMECRK